ncbi:MAG: VCBS repeat-containing protein [gamma proteobacterium symbiont of Bathyaustriella thionipta]|nr:VCBS repeat-containing protein [gamma proteobacterium symbiont of Bathyaustriella thionipta]
MIFKYALIGLLPFLGWSAASAAESINSTSQAGVSSAVTQQPQPGSGGAGNNSYAIFATNDLGMHCGDLDTRVSSILPPFNVVHAQILLKGSDPQILTESDGIGVRYSAASNINDPALSGLGAGGEALLSSIVGNQVYKTNFWDSVSGSTESIALKAYRPFYPPGILDAFSPAAGVGLPVPDVERLYLGDGQLVADQQAMPGVAQPYSDNQPQPFGQFVAQMPFFINFPFGYTASDVNWFEAAGIPLSTFDDKGLENAYPLLRVQAVSNQGSVLATVDTVTPISGEANCQACHAAVEDGGNGAASGRQKGAVATAFEDPNYGDVPLAVSQEYAADINILRLHDQKHATNLENTTPIVCQTCHYTPALDLAQVGPSGPENDQPGQPGNPSNGRDQVKNKSMSNVMHSHHATVTDLDNNALFPAMPAPIDSAGNKRDPQLAGGIVLDTCYQCHPGKRNTCLRGAMASADVVCQDCHGNMAQVGDDFSGNVSPQNPGKFELASDFFTNAATPRVPWANEPGCGSCHSGDANDNMHNRPGAVGSADNSIRLLQAWISNDKKAKPVVPDNKRFAENTQPSGAPMLYRLSKGHGGVFCEGCHGSTHAIWPNANFWANDNVAAQQIQGHSGVITECNSCHADGDLGVNLDGPHGMHPVGVVAQKFVDGGHKSLVESDGDGETDGDSGDADILSINSVLPTGKLACAACHGADGLGTVLSKVSVDRSYVVECENGTFCPGQEVDNFTINFKKGYQVGCVECHSNKLGGDLAAPANDDDFGGDRQADILLRNTDSGQLWLYEMDAEQIIASNNIGGLSLDWDVAGVGDLGGDGKADIVLRNHVSGQLYLYEMFHNQRTGSNIGGLSLAWEVAGIADLGGDGKDDIVLRNKLNGQLWLYEMNGNIRNGSNIGGLALTWEVAGMGDLGGDGKEDLVLRNKTSGQLYLYEMNGSSRFGSNIGGLSLNWVVIAVADLGGDGKADIVIRNKNTGQLYLYEMNHNQRVGSSIGALDLNRVVERVADYNGDGRADLLIRDHSSGQMFVDEMNHNIRVRKSMGSLGAAWQIQPNRCYPQVSDGPVSCTAAP